MAEHQEEKNSMPVHFPSWKSYAASAVVFSIIALVLFYPLVLHMGTATPGSGGDSFQNLWDVWWVNYALFHMHASIYSTYLLYWPVGVNLISQTMSPMLALLAAPFMGLGTVFAYNIMFLVSFVLSGIAMMVLAKYVIRNTYAAFFAGAVFAFGSFHIASAYAHIHFINTMWVPLFLYFLLRTIREDKRVTNVVGMSASFAFSALMGSMQQAIMLAMVFVLVVVGYALFKRHRVITPRFWINIAGFAILALILGSWLFVPILSALSKGSLQMSSVNSLNDVQHNELWSSAIASFFVPSYYNGIFHWLTQGTYTTLYAGVPAERTAYLTFTALLLAAYGIYKQRRHAALWIAGAAVFGLLSLGPQLELFGSVSPVPGLYYLYHAIPYINIIREPGRFNLITTMFFAVLAGMGLKLLLDKAKAWKMPGGVDSRLVVAAAVTVLFLIESNGMPLSSAAIGSLVSTQVSVPQLYPLIGQLQGDFSILQLPALPSASGKMLPMGKATYYTSITHKPLVGGYVTRSNVTDTLSLYNMPLTVQDQNLGTYGNMSFSSPVQQNYTNQTLLTMYNYYTRFVVLDKTAYNTSSLDKIGAYLYKTFGAPVYNDNTTTAFMTSNAINASIFKSYVSYPILTQWQSGYIPLNGTYRQAWSPLQSGAVVVYAPYSNSSGIASKVASGMSYSINTTIMINALAASPRSLYVVEQTGTSPTTLAQFNLTSSMQEYKLNVTLPSGPEGTTLFFIPSSGSNATIAISNITFSRRAT